MDPTALVSFAGSYVGGKFCDWAIKHGFLAVAGTKEARAEKKIIRQAFEDAARIALSEAYSDPQALNDEESAKALAEHTTSYLTTSPVGEYLLKYAAARDSSKADEVVSLIEDDFNIDWLLDLPRFGRHVSFTQRPLLSV